MHVMNTTVASKACNNKNCCTQPAKRWSIYMR